MRKKYLIVLVMTFAIFIAGCSKSNTNIKEYVNSGEAIDLYAKNFMPAIEDLSKYKDISYEYNREYFLFFIADSMALVVGYDEENYKSEKEKLTNNYTFLNEKITDENSSYIIPEYNFYINSYNFNVVEKSIKEEADFPKSFGMIGTSDEKRSIAYLYFYDTDLDYISEKEEKNPMANFVKRYYKYDF